MSELSRFDFIVLDICLALTTVLEKKKIDIALAITLVLGSTNTGILQGEK